MKLSIIIPVYNEKGTILKIIEKVNNVTLEKELIVVDDGSTDGTKEILKNIQNANFSDKNIKIIFKKKNEGKGSAIREGLKKVTGDIVTIQDADMEYEPMDFMSLVKPIEEGKTRVVYGSRFLGKNLKSSLGFYLGGRLLSFLVSILYGEKITDEPTCYKVFKTEVIKSIPLRCTKFEFCPEITAKVIKRGYRIVELPIHYNPRSIKEGKKIRLKDGISAIWTLLKYRLVG
ncbi:MAG: glycosyltransferase family 2 protein [Cyanobacteria bacterium]|nr:glycosyltransferase family 2 protein [Cyanobacteriota bacterium]